MALVGVNNDSTYVDLENQLVSIGRLLQLTVVKLPFLHLSHAAWDNPIFKLGHRSHFMQVFSEVCCTRTVNR